MSELKSLYQVTGDIKDINSVIINRNEYRALNAALADAYRMLRDSLDTNLMLSEKLTNAQARWLGRDGQTTN